MVYVGVFPEIDPETTEKLASETKKLWTAAHEDGSDNRVNGDAVLEASSYDLTFGFLAAGFMWVRKLFRNRGKTREDLKAEKEAAGINRTCGALEQMLLEYFRSAQEGAVDGEALDELIDTLDEMHRHYKSGKLSVPGEKELSGMRKSIAAYTAAIAESRSALPVPETGSSGMDEFSLIREQLIAQKKLICETPSP